MAETAREVALTSSRDWKGGDEGSWLSDEVGAVREEGGPRILVTITEAPGADRLIERAAQMAAQVGGEFIGVHVRTGAGRKNGGLDARRQLLEELGGDYREVAGDDVAAALLAVARAEGVTQLVVGTSRRPWWRELISGSIVRDLVRGSEEIDVHVIATPEAVGTRRPLRRRRLSGVGSRRRRAGYVVGVVGLVVLTVLLNAFDQPPALSSILLSYLALVVAASGIGGAGPAVLTTLGAFGLADFFFTTPYHTFVIDEPSVVVALVVFTSVAAVVSWLVDHAARRQAEADRAGAEARTLSRLTTTLFESDDPLPQLVTDLVATYELDAAALLRRHNGGWTSPFGPDTGLCDRR